MLKCIEYTPQNEAYTPHYGLWNISVIKRDEMIEKFIGSIIGLKNVDHFSVIEIRTAYVAIKRDQTLDPSQVRRLVYTELLKLENRGWLKKRISKTKGISRYSKTDKFDYADILPLCSNELFNKPIVNVSPVNNTQLLKRLNNYNTKLLEGIGSTQEFESLITEFPELRQPVQATYNQVREQNAQLMGKIKSLETIINLQSVKK
jgi:hypothetical protein